MRGIDLLQPSISPSPDAAPFWAAAAQHRLEIPRCNPCGRHFFYPRALCPLCGSRDVGWVESAGTGVLYSFCIQHRSSVPGLAEATPFVTCLVDLDEGVRLMSFLVGVPPEPDQITCAMRVRVDFHDLRDGHTLPVFRPAS
ncbi:Zn-ribbon domain-containing OB-fold protein [Actinophytocola sp.]|uniref:Zn-ribbon domain-containing OB-fold protein n=1 Tax=Actinophytocola sp. TaxID=1872138 RepID=UPI003D6BD56E